MKKNKDGGLGGGGSPVGDDLPDGVVLRRKELPSTPFGRPGGPSPYSFMRRSCTFIAESSLGLRKSANRASGPPPVRPWVNGKSPATTDKTTPKKEAKDRKNLALQVRQKKESLDDSPNGRGKGSTIGSMATPSRNGGGGSGRVSRLVGGLRAWSSTEDVRQSVVGAFGRAWSRRDSQEKGLTPLKETNTPVKSNSRSSNIVSKSSSNIKTTTPTSSKQLKFSKSMPPPTDTKVLRTSSSKNKETKPNKDTNLSKDKKLNKDRKSVSDTRLLKPRGGGSSTKENKSSNVKDRDNGDSRWFRHIQEAQEAYSARDGRNRRSHPQRHPGSDDDPADPLGGDNEIVEGEVANGDGGMDSSLLPTPQSIKVDDGSKQDESCIGSPTSNSTSTATLQPPGSPETVSNKTEHLRRKDLKIRQALEEKQHIIADILNIPAEHFENVADMAGEPAVGNKEPRELVLAAMYQAKCLQESLNEALNISESDVVAARANNENPSSKTHLPLYQAPMTKLMNISTSLSSQLTSLLNLISERDDERERMRKELVASRERLHLFHMKQNSLSSSSQAAANPSFSGVPGTPPSATSPHTSRPNSFISVTSSAADHSDTPEHHDTDEESRGDVAKRNSHNEEETEESKEDSVIETFEDAVSASEAVERTSALEESDKSIVDGETIGNAISEADTT